MLGNLVKPPPGSGSGGGGGGEQGYGYGAAATMIGSAIASSRSVDDPFLPAPPTGPPGTAVRRKKYGDLLFVQDDEVLLLVAPSRVAQTHGPARVPALCSAFTVWVCAPMVHVDCHVDLFDSRVLHVVVRAWGEEPHMTPLQAAEPLCPPVTVSRGGAAAGGRGRPEVPSLLRPRAAARGALWCVSVMLDSAYSCSLAAQHIDGRRYARLGEVSDAHFQAHQPLVPPFLTPPQGCAAGPTASHVSPCAGGLGRRDRRGLGRSRRRGFRR